MVDFRINETLQIGAVGNSAYQTGERKCLFIFMIHYNLIGCDSSHQNGRKQVT